MTVDDLPTGGARITLSASDGTPGVSGVYYQFDGGAEAPYAAPVTVTAGGSHTLHYRVVDRAGNTTQGDRSFVVQSDRVPPRISAQAATLSGISYGPGQWETHAVIVTFLCTDAESGVASVAGPRTITTEGLNQSVTGTCTDRAGNTSQVTFGGIDIDQTPPATTATLGLTPDGAPQLRLSATDSLSGVDHIAYRIDGGADQVGLYGPGGARRVRGAHGDLLRRRPGGHARGAEEPDLLEAAAAGADR